MDIIKNPVVLGLFAGILTFAYISWSNSKKINKKNKKSNEYQYVGLVVPAVVAILIWFIAYGYQEYNVDNVDNLNIKKKIHNSAFLNDLNNSNNSLSLLAQSFELINKGVKIPTKMPDVFIETF